MVLCETMTTVIFPLFCFVGLIVMCLLLSLFQGCSPTTKSKLPGLISILDSTVSLSLRFQQKTSFVVRPAAPDEICIHLVRWILELVDFDLSFVGSSSVGGISGQCAGNYSSPTFKLVLAKIRNFVQWRKKKSCLPWVMCSSPFQNDPNKQTNMPADGTVHELTSNVSVQRNMNWHCPLTALR